MLVREVLKREYKITFTSYLKKLKYLIKDNLMFSYILIFMVIKSIIFLNIIISIGGINSSLHSVSKLDIVITTLFTLSLLSFAFLLRGKLHYWYLIFIDIFVTIILIGDLIYYRGFQGFLSPYLLVEITSLENMSSDIFSLFKLEDVVFFVDFILILLLNKVFFRNAKKQKRSVVLFLLTFVISVGIIYGRHYKVDVLENNKNDMFFKVRCKPFDTMTTLSPIGYHEYDIYNYLSESKSIKLTTDDYEEVSKWFKNNAELIPDNKYKGIFKGKNLICIQVESLEKFVINQKINNQEITPNLNKLINKSMYFTSIYEQVNDGASSDSDLMVNTSVYPVRVGSTFYRFPNNKYNSLPLMLQKEGYSTLAVHADRGGFWNWMPALYSIGFQKCLDTSNFKVDETIGLGLSDGSYLKQLVPMLTNQKSPFYNFIVTLTSHGPFDLPKKYRELNIKEELDKTKLGGYFQSINYTDRQLGIFLESLDKEKILDNSVVVICGDHTGVHKYYQEEINKIRPQENWWNDDKLNIPLIIYSKGLEAEQIKVKGGQIDIMPTIAYLMGVERNKLNDTAFGRILVNTNRNFTVLKDKTIIGSLEKDENNQFAENVAKEGLNIADKVIRSNYYKLDHNIK